MLRPIQLVTEGLAVAPKREWDFSVPRQIIKARLGVEVLRELHKSNFFLDTLLVSGSLLVFAALWYWLVLTPLGMLWLVGAFFLALTVSVGFYGIRHDLFFHRQCWGPTASYLAGVGLSLLMLQPYTKFACHADHHKHIEWDLYEIFAKQLDRRWKRWLCLTFIGQSLLMEGKLRAARVPDPNSGWIPPTAYQTRLRKENVLHLAFFLLLVAATWRWPTILIKGFILPNFIFVPPIAMIRIILQHGEVKKDNPFGAVTYFTTGRMVRFLFCQSLGDSHLAHHLYERVPIYNVGKLAELIHPIVIEHHVKEYDRFGVLKILFRYFFAPPSDPTRR